MAEQVSLKAIVTGRVQGVNFRDFTRQKARALGLAGYVRNLPGGDVEVLAEGERPALETLLEYLKQGPPRANVYHVASSWEEPSGGRDEFKILY
jgi:acylphosphatase